MLVGPSGCGKSTTLRMIAGLESISSGTMTIGDRVVNDVAPKDRDIAMVFQNYALYPHMDVFDNMAFGLKLRKYPKAEIQERVDRAASILGLSGVLDRKPKALSGGQRQRVALGRAIVRKPSVFLFDEPLSNLDAKLRVQTRTEISKLHTDLGATMIYVTHDQVEAMTMGDRIVVLDDGRVQQMAPPLELYNRPANTFVASFIGSPAMNLLAGTLGDGAFRSASGAVEVDGVDGSGGGDAGAAARGPLHRGPGAGGPAAERAAAGRGRGAGADGQRGSSPTSASGTARRRTRAWWRGSSRSRCRPPASRSGCGPTSTRRTCSTARRGAASRRAAPRRHGELPPRLRVGRGHLGLPDRGVAARRRRRAVDLAPLRAHARPRRRRHHGRRRLRTTTAAGRTTWR